MLDLMVRDAGPSAVVVPLLVPAAVTVVMTGVAARLSRWDAD